MLTGIENIVFDLGGVIINLNHELTWRAFKAHFPTNFTALHQQIKNNQLLERFETGKIESSTFTHFFIENSSMSHHEVIEAWNSMLLDLPDERIQLIKRLSKKYRLFLLSNTNEIHYSFIENMYHVKENNNFSTLFEKCYLSFQVGFRKPEKEIFEHLIKTSNLNPSKTLFIDDTAEHIVSAKSIGIKSVFLDINNNQSINSLLNEY